MRKMCYLVAFNPGKTGCIAILHEGGKKLVDFERKLMTAIGQKPIQLVVISHPNVYGEYAPYRFADTEEEFEEAVKAM